MIVDAHELSRREFLWLTAAVLMAATPDTTEAQESMVAYPPRRIDGAETLLPGQSLYFAYPTSSDPAVLLKSNDGEYRAYSRRCSHAGCSVDFDPSSRCLKCPCHQGQFDGRMGQVMFGPPKRPLDEVVLQVRAGGRVWAVGKSFGRNMENIAEAVGGGD